MRPVTRIPKLYLWENQLLFLAASYMPYREHTVVSDKLIVSIQGEMTITLDDGRQITTRSCLVRAGMVLKKECIDATNAVTSIYYLAPMTQDYLALESIMPKAIEGVNYAHPQEEYLVQQLLRVRDDNLSPQQAYLLLRNLIVQPHLSHVIFKKFDPRIIEIIRRIRETVRENVSVVDLAEEVNLSESRLEKLFKDQIGVPITRYRLRYRVFVGTIYIAFGHSVTDAGFAAGFASSAHFSKSFSSINGIPPSATFLKPPFLEMKIADEVYEMMAPRMDNMPIKKIMATNQ